MSRIFRKSFLSRNAVGNRKRYQMWLRVSCEIRAWRWGVRIAETQTHFFFVAVHVKNMFGAGSEVCLQGFSLIVSSR